MTSLKPNDSSVTTQILQPHTHMSSAISSSSRSVPSPLVAGITLVFSACFLSFDPLPQPICLPSRMLIILSLIRSVLLPPPLQVHQSLPSETCSIRVPKTLKKGANCFSSMTQSSLNTTSTSAKQPHPASFLPTLYSALLWTLRTQLGRKNACPFQSLHRNPRTRH